MDKKQLREDLKKLLTRTDTTLWKVSVIVPLEKGAPHAKENLIQIKNAFKEALEKIELTVEDKGQQRELAKIINNLQEKIEFHNGGGTYVCYISMEEQIIFQLPFNVKRKVVVDQSYEIRDILYVLNRTPEYHVFLVSQESPRLYYGIGKVLYPIFQNKLPSFLDLYPDLEKPSIQFYSRHIGGYDTGIKQKERIQTYISRLANIVYDLLNEKPNIPLFVIGSEKLLGFLKETHLSKLIAEYIYGVYDFSSENELCDLVYPYVLEFHKNRRYKFLQENLQEAISQGKASLGLQEVWAACIEHRIYTLGVEEDFVQPAFVNKENPYDLIIVSNDEEKEEKEGYQFHEDIVDDIIESVLNEGGEVIFFKKEELHLHNRIVSVNRY